MTTLVLTPDECDWLRASLARYADDLGRRGLTDEERQVELLIGKLNQAQKGA